MRKSQQFSMKVKKPNDKNKDEIKPLRDPREAK